MKYTRVTLHLSLLLLMPFCVVASDKPKPQVILAEYKRQKASKQPSLTNALENPQTPLTSPGAFITQEPKQQPAPLTNNPAHTVITIDEQPEASPIQPTSYTLNTPPAEPIPAKRSLYEIMFQNPHSYATKYDGKKYPDPLDDESGMETFNSGIDWKDTIKLAKHSSEEIMAAIAKLRPNPCIDPDEQNALLTQQTLHSYLLSLNESMNASTVEQNNPGIITTSLPELTFIKPTKEQKHLIDLSDFELVAEQQDYLEKIMGMLNGTRPSYTTEFSRDGNGAITLQRKEIEVTIAKAFQSKPLLDALKAIREATKTTKNCLWAIKPATAPYQLTAEFLDFSTKRHPKQTTTDYLKAKQDLSKERSNIASSIGRTSAIEQYKEERDRLVVKPTIELGDALGKSERTAVQTILSFWGTK